MAANKSTKNKAATKPIKMSGEARRVRRMNIIFLAITALLILSMIFMAVGKF
ncbi:MAG: hypothetical protein WCE68_09080 [Anaerolineales bacterium]